MPINPDEVVWDEIDPNAIQWEGKKQPTDYGRQIGIGTRGVAEGLASIPMMVGDAANALLNTGAWGINKLFGTDIPRLQSASESFSNLLPLPKPETPQEEMTYQISKGGAGAMSMPLAAYASGAKTLAPLLASPGLQTLAGMTSAGTSEKLQQEGFSPAVQMGGGLLAGIATPMVAGGLMSTAKGVGRGLKGVFDPMTQRGRELAVGGALRRLASDEGTAMANLQAAEPIIPGSMPTTGTTAKDYGLAAAERTLKSKAPARFAEREAAQNIARLDVLDKYANADLVKSTAKRDAALGLLDKARQSNPNVNIQPVVDKIDEILASGAGKRQAVKTALNHIKQNLYDNKGNLERSLDNIYGIRKDIGDFFEKGPIDPDKISSAMRTARREVMQVKNSLDEQLGKSSDDFMQYLKVYARQSKPVAQIEAAKILKEKAHTTATDIQGEYFITPGTWNTHFNRKFNQLKEVLSPKQMRELGKITKDIDRGNVLASVKPLGSDTVQNLSVSHVIGRALGAKEQPSNVLMRTLERPISFLYKVADDALEELLVDAMLDPKLAAELMKKATPSRMESISEILSNRLKASVYGSTIGTQEQ